MFQIHSQLKKNLLPIAELPLSLVFLFPDSNNPWVVLVPKVADITEWHHLPQSEQILLLQDINLISNIMEKEFHPDKINVASLGNMVSQLHIHIICRYKSDKAWPRAIWGTAPGDNQAIMKTWINFFKTELNKNP